MLDSNALKEFLKKFKTFSQQSRKEQAKLLAKWEFFCNDTKFQAHPFGIEPEEELCKKVVKYSKDISLKSEAYLFLAREFIDNCKSQPNLLHREKRKYLEEAIRVLLEVIPEAETQKINLLNEIYFTIAKAYLLRSQIFRPKGMTVPEKKKEALKKALEWVKRIDFNNLEEAYLLKSEIYLELERIDERLADDAKETFEHGLNCKDCKAEPHIIAQIAVRWAELKNDINTKNILQTKVLEQSDVSHLEKAKAAFLLGQQNKVEQYLKRLSNELRNRYCLFSNPLWDGTVKFLKQLKDSNMDIWKDVSIKIWEVCEEKVRKASALHMRWYWSRQRDLYDLAFLAEEDPYKKAKIADSLKSRPSQKYKVWEKEARKYLEQEEAALGKRYIKEIEYDETPLPKLVPFTSLPAPWIAIHFYLNHLEKKGYALIYDAKKQKWEQPLSFEFYPIFEAFEVWQTNYFERKIGAAKFLEGLCKEIGNQMSFLFELPSERPVLFITHDFIHRLPLHAAIKNRKLFLDNNPSMYLPAWGFITRNDAENPRGRILLQNFKKYDFPKLKGMFGDQNPPPATRDHLKAMNEPPELLVILCHGTSDIVNPFSAKLHLAEGGITHREILRSELYINNSIVVLGACDTDLVPPITTSLDEHLSLNTAFLTKGARAVVGTLWKIKAEEMETFILRLDNSSARSSNIVYIIQELQKEASKKWKQNKKPEILYESMCFKAIGYPLLRNTP